MTRPTHPSGPVRRRPAPRSGLFEALSHQDGDPAIRLDAAHETAAALLAAGRREQPDERVLVGLADLMGLDEMASLWGPAEPASLPRCLWTLYALRAWCHGSAAEVSRLFTAGQPYAEVAAAISGLPDAAEPAEVAAFGDTLLLGALCRDLAGGLERAAAFCRVVAAGRAEEPELPREHSWQQAVLGSRLLTTADNLTRAAVAAREGSLR